MQEQGGQKNQFSNTKISTRVRNRRYAKLLQLRKQGYFDQQSIKLRHPLVYHMFVGQYQYQCQSTYSNSNHRNNKANETMMMQSQQQQQNSTNKNNQHQRGLSVFLQSHLLNLQYKQLLQKQLTPQLQELMLKDNIVNQQEIKQLKRGSQRNNGTNIKSRAQCEIEQQQQQNYQYHHHHHHSHISLTTDTTSNQHLPTSTSSSQPPLTLLPIQQRQLQQQHLIQYCQQLFLQGKLHHTDGINYNEIDNDDCYDRLSQEERDLEDKYFNQIEQEMELLTNNNDIDNSQYDGETGIQDY